jgi:putative transposase
MPFGELAWDHARRNLEQHGRTATEADIADAVAALLTRAYRGPEPGSGPASKRDQRVAARTRAVSPLLRAAEQEPPREASPPPEPKDSGSGQEHLAEVIPMPLFDPFDDPDIRW